MALTSLGAAGSAPPPTWQEQLWDEIQTETNAKRPKKAGDDASVCPPFPEQKCDRYNGDWFCWSTTPDALRRVLDSGQDKAAYAVTTHDEEAGATGAGPSVDRGVPGAALVYGWQHWVVVNRYFAGADGETTHICLRDPLDEKFGDTHEVILEDWNRDYLSFVPAGKYRDKIVVVGGESRVPVRAFSAPPPVPVSGSGHEAPAHKDGGPQRGAGPLIPAETAIQVAEGERRRMLERPSRWGRALGDALPERSALLLERLDHHDTYDYIA